MVIKTEHTKAEGKGVRVQPETRKPYAKPKIIHELELETKAGTPLSPPWSDIPGLNPPILPPHK